MERTEINKSKELNIDIDTVDSLRSLYGLQDFEEESIINVVKALREYTNLEEQGLLIRLPCKAGDIVYKLWYEPCHKGEECPGSYLCCGCEDECDLKRAIFEYEVPNQKWILQHLDCFGENIWFITREAAEEKLKELQSK